MSVSDVTIYPGCIRRHERPGIASFIVSTPQTSTVTWVDPTVSGSQLALKVLYIWENDLTQTPAPQAYIGSVAPGVGTFTTGVLPVGARRSYQVQAEDIAGNRGPFSAASTEIDAPTAPGAPANVVAVLNLT